MRIAFSAKSWAEYKDLRDRDPKVAEKLEALILECARSPFRGTGKPEPLKNDLKGWWSRRLTQEHRFVYRVVGIDEGKTLEIRQCRFHY